MKNQGSSRLSRFIQPWLGNLWCAPHSYVGAEVAPLVAQVNIRIGKGTPQAGFQYPSNLAMLSGFSSLRAKISFGSSPQGFLFPLSPITICSCKNFLEQSISSNPFSNKVAFRSGSVSMPLLIPTCDITCKSNRGSGRLCTWLRFARQKTEDAKKTDNAFLLGMSSKGATTIRTTSKMQIQTSSKTNVNEGRIATPAPYALPWSNSLRRSSASNWWILRPRKREYFEQNIGEYSKPFRQTFVTNIQCIPKFLKRTSPCYRDQLGSFTNDF